MILRPLRTILAGSIDYAGLFPPAELGMREAVGNYADYLSREDAWALGRFVVPLSRIEELEEEAEKLWVHGSPVWGVSVLVASVTGKDMGTIASFNERVRGSAVIDTIESRSSSPEDIRPQAAVVGRTAALFVEVPLNARVEESIRALKEAGANAKVRTGGATPDAFPSPDELVAFLKACVELGVPFKATAGLHHPLRSEYRLTYKPDSESAPMYGYVNMFLAAALLVKRAPQDDVGALLLEDSANELKCSESTISWRSHEISVQDLQRLRRDVFLSFGSCSFREPLDDLAALHFAQRAS